MVARVLLFVLAGLMLGAGPCFSQAVLLYDNGGSDYFGGFEMTEWTVADDFEIDFSAEATRVSIGMSDLTCTFPANWDGYLRWWIHLDDGGVPGGYVASGFAPEVSVTMDHDNCPTAAYYSLQFKLGQMVPLVSGVRYWLALHMAADWSVNSALYWSATSPGNYSSAVSRFGGTDPWSTVGLEHAFRISLVGSDDYLFVDGFECGDTSIWSLTVP